MSSTGIPENPLHRFSSESTGRLYSSPRYVLNLSAETTPIIAHTENSGEGGVPSNSQSTYTNHNFLTAGDIIESNKAMLSEQWQPLLLWVTNCMST